MRDSVSIASFLQSRIIEFGAKGKRIIELCLLRVRRIDSIAEGSSYYNGLSHVAQALFLSKIGEAQVSIASADLSRHHYSTKRFHTNIKSKPLPPRFIPRLKPGDFSLRTVKNSLLTSLLLKEAIRLDGDARPFASALSRPLCRTCPARPIARSAQCGRR